MRGANCARNRAAAARPSITMAGWTERPVPFNAIAGAARASSMRRQCPAARLEAKSNVRIPMDNGASVMLIRRLSPQP